MTTLATAVTSPAATEAREGSRLRHGAPNPAIVSSFDAEEHGDHVGQHGWLGCLTDEQLHRSRRREASALMAKHGTGQEGGRVEDGVKQKLTTVAVKAVAWSEELCGRSNRRRRFAGPAAAR